MPSIFLYPICAAGKAPPIADETPMLLTGAGAAGLAAILEGARISVHVTRINENPVSSKTMDDEVPLYFGGRMGGQIANANAMLERMIEARPGKCARCPRCPFLCVNAKR